MDFTGITEGIKAVGGMVTSVFDFLGKGKLDETKAMELGNALQTKIRELESSAFALQLSLTEKLMVGAGWTKPLALITGIALVAVCVFNIIAPALGLQSRALAIESWEVLILLGLFTYVTTGSSKILFMLVEAILERRAKNKTDKPKENEQ